MSTLADWCKLVADEVKKQACSRADLKAFCNLSYSQIEAAIYQLGDLEGLVICNEGKNGIDQFSWKGSQTKPMAHIEISEETHTQQRAGAQLAEGKISVATLGIKLWEELRKIIAEYADGLRFTTAEIRTHLSVRFPQTKNVTDQNNLSSQISTALSSFASQRIIKLVEKGAGGKPSIWEKLSQSEPSAETAQDTPELEFNVSTSPAPENTPSSLQTAEKPLLRPCSACKIRDAANSGWDTCNLCTGLAIQQYLKLVPSDSAAQGWASYEDLKRNGEVQSEAIKKLRKAIQNHRDQKADDRCWEDDLALYSVLEDDVVPDNHVGDTAAMLRNCERFIEQRCQGGGDWKSYAEL